MDDATRARLEHVVAAGTWPILTLSRGDVLDLLNAYDAQAARLAAVEHERDRLRRTVERLERATRGVF
jgi:hypothetical protein